MKGESVSRNNGGLRRKKGRQKRQVLSKEEYLKRLPIGIGKRVTLDDGSDPMEEFDLDDPLCPSSDDDDAPLNRLLLDRWISESDDEDFSKALSADPQFVKGKKEADEKEQSKSFQRRELLPTAKIVEKVQQAAREGKTPQKEIPPTPPNSPAEAKSAQDEAKSNSNTEDGHKAAKPDAASKGKAADETVEENKDDKQQQPPTAYANKVEGEENTSKSNRFEEIEDWKTAVLREIAARRHDLVVSPYDEGIPVWMKPITDLEKRDTESEPMEEDKESHEDSESQD
ncbi:hypothetical protein TTRE_0000462301 [Trichuris trichiura]|uniref:Uncharacterized protein n=1 Tax=Trichuris trichiura TaxID=36087 RepID=A0A077Z801_TRITR|nr:hypothetical protein TTRE_0000462301 [Trichuris trichiura]